MAQLTLKYFYLHFYYKHLLEKKKYPFAKVAAHMLSIHELIAFLEDCGIEYFSDFKLGYFKEFEDWYLPKSDKDFRAVYYEFVDFIKVWQKRMRRLKNDV